MTRSTGKLYTLTSNPEEEKGKGNQPGRRRREDERDPARQKKKRKGQGNSQAGEEEARDRQEKKRTGQGTYHLGRRRRRVQSSYKASMLDGTTTYGKDQHVFDFQTFQTATNIWEQQNNIISQLKHLTLFLDLNAYRPPKTHSPLQSCSSIIIIKHDFGLKTVSSE